MMPLEELYAFYHILQINRDCPAQMFETTILGGQKLHYSDEPTTYTVKMTGKGFDKLQEMLTLTQKEKQDQKIRESSVAVQKAYEDYEILLELARNNQLD
jgi:hypothetical protein